MTRVLIIEDQEDMGETIKRCLDTISVLLNIDEITIARNLASGKRIIQETPRPIVTFLDLGLPDSDWIATIKEIPTLEEFSPVIIVTGHSREEVMTHILNPEVEVINKNPSMWDKVAGSMARALQRRRAHSTNLEELDEILTKLKNAPQ